MPIKRILILLILIIPILSKAQQKEKIELLNADVSEFDESLNANATRLIGHVIFRHQNALMNCDSAYLYRNENRIEAFNNVKINSHIDYFASFGDTFSEHDVEFNNAERRCYFVFHHFYFRGVANDFFFVFDAASAANVEAYGRIKFQRVAARRCFRVAEHHADFHTDLVDENDGAIGA